MSFSQKTTARNLFRYKKRFFMTVLGVAGCTALLLIGFGLQDSLLPIVTKQSTELSHNDLTVTLSDPAAFTVEKGLTDALEGGQVENWAAVYSKSVTIYNAAGESAGVSVVGAQTDSQLGRYVTFRTRQGHKAIPFEKDSVVLTEKTALNLGVEPGDSIWVENPDGERVEMTLTGVTENYMFTRLYVSNAQLQTLLHPGHPLEHGVRPDPLRQCRRPQHHAGDPAGLQLCDRSLLYRGCHLHVRQPYREPELGGGADHRVCCGPGGGGAVQPDQREPGRAQKGAGHHQGAGLL